MIFPDISLKYGVKSIVYVKDVLLGVCVSLLIIFIKSPSGFVLIKDVEPSSFINVELNIGEAIVIVGSLAILELTDIYDGLEVCCKLG